MPVRAHVRIVPVVILLLGTLAVSLLGCNSTTTCEEACFGFHPQVFKYALPVGATGDIATLDPNLADDSASRTVVSLLYGGLVTLDQNLQVEPWGASKVDVSADGLTYTFHLSAHQEFADGTPVTAADYAYSINRALNPCLASPNAPMLFAIKDAATFAQETCTNGQISINTTAGQTGPLITTLIGDSLQTPNDSTLVITLAQPAAYFLAALAAPVADALNPKLVGTTTISEQWVDSLGQGTTEPATSGMFQVRKWDHAGGSIVLVANPYWWGLSQGKKPYLTEIDVTLFKSADTLYGAYQAGHFHEAPTPAQQVAATKSQPDFHSVGTLTYYGLSINWFKPPFINLDARQAFCLAVNRDALNQAAYGGTLIAHWNIIPQGMPGYNPKITGPDGVTTTTGDDAAAARHWAAYLTNSGASPTTPIAYLYDASDPTGKIAAQTLQAQWEQALGVLIVLKGESHSAWLRDVTAGNYLITPESASADYPDPQDVLSARYLPVGDSQGPDVPDANTLMAGADANGNQTTRLQEYQQAEQLLVTNVATCPLFQGQAFYQVRQCIHNWSLAANGLTPLDAWITTYIDNTCPNT